MLIPYVTNLSTIVFYECSCDVDDAHRSRVGRRNFASYDPMVTRKVEASKSSSEIWLGDKGAWPVIAIISAAAAFASFWSLSTLFTNPDVRIRKSNRSKLIRDWEVKGH